MKLSMKIYDQVHFVRYALELLSETGHPQRRSAQVAAIRAAFLAQDQFTRALLTRFYPDRLVSTCKSSRHQ